MHKLRLHLKLTKIWNDNNDKAGKRPETVTLQIKNGNSIVEYNSSHIFAGIGK